MICDRCQKGIHKECHDITVVSMFPSEPVFFKPGPESGYYDKEHPNEWQIFPSKISHDKLECLCKINKHRRINKW